MYNDNMVTYIINYVQKCKSKEKIKCIAFIRNKMVSVKF